ncbi:phospholipase effector Tle1 domain-containing protein, partial [Heyndrickxia sporothermodurans]
LVGFSRGAYTVRCLANLLMLCGIPTTTPDGPMRRFRKRTHDIAEEAVSKVLMQGAGKPRGMYEADRLEQARRFRNRYGSNAADNAESSNTAPYFIGVFDTVAALGSRGLRRILLGAGLLAVAVAGVAATAGLLTLTVHAPFRPTFLVIALLTLAYTAWRWSAGHVKATWYPDRKGWRRWWPSWHLAVWRAGQYDRLLSRSVRFARSANAIDETRADFDRVRWGGKAQDHVEGEPEPFRQMWFAGNHSDVGGSYPEPQSRLSDIALDWMLSEARSLPHPLLLEENRLHRHQRADGVQHCEVAGMHDAVERHV